ncbi:Nnf1-domain-containing protein [Peziza echinospora]|nr:Nnf1-domain-containing protein [Peziza echinospora]
MSTSDPPPQQTPTSPQPQSTPTPAPAPAPAPTHPASSSPARPPPPQPPIPGPRATAFREVLHRALTQSLKACPYPHFASCFPTLSTHNPSVLSQIHRQYLFQLENLATQSFDQLLEDRRVVENLNALEALVAEARERKRLVEGERGVGVVEVSPSTLPPSAIITAHITPLILAAQTTIKSKLDAVTAENEALMKAIEDQKKEIRALVGMVEKVVGDMQGAVEVVGECFPPGRKVGLVEGDRLGDDDEGDEEEGEGGGNEGFGGGGGAGDEGDRMEGIE